MSRIDDMIERFCPNGVEFKKLGEIGQLVRGNGLPKTAFTATGVGAIHYGQIYTYYGISTTETISFVAPDTAAKLVKVNPGDIIITNTSENLEDVGKAVAWLGDKQIVTGGHATVLKHRQEPKYIAYWLQSSGFQVQKRKLATGTKVIDLSAKSLANIEIPVPPVEVQRMIVHVLDLFTELEAKLDEELEARQLQYRHYRDLLFASCETTGLQRTPLGELGAFIRGRRFTKADVTADGIPAIHYGEIYTHYGVATNSTVSHVRYDLANQLRYAQAGDVIFTAVGEVVEDMAKAVAWLGNEQVAIHDDTFLFRGPLNPKFVSYFAQTSDFHAQKNKYVARAKVKRLSGESLAKIMIPVPSREKQDEIVAVLDKFDALLNDLNIGLPAELHARRKQYEHYRDRLLAFKELAA